MKQAWRRAAVLISILTAAASCGRSDLGEETSKTSSAAGADLQSFLVVHGRTGTDAARSVAAAGGVLVYTYPEIGVTIARGAASFGETFIAQEPDALVSATTTFGVRGVGGDVGGAAAAPLTGAEPLGGLQWDMRQIHVPEAHAVTLGSRDVLVADIDTGADWTHPDLAANIDFASSVSCVGGVPNQDPAAWDDDVGHGTHTAGTIAAAANGVGITGVAPGVRLAVIKAGNVDNLFFPEAVVCAFYWAATHGVRVANNSYYADPWLYNCRNDPGQRAIWIAEQRAIRFAMQRGVLVVAGAGNEFEDIAHPTTDSSSPDYPPGTEVERDVNNACVIVPLEIPGVVGVGATGNLRQKALYSNYGLGSVDVAAPGGDSYFQVTTEAVNGLVLSTWPAKFGNATHVVVDATVSPPAYYRYLQGTSMAAPHVTGVAALILSRSPGATPGAVASLIASTADPIACPANPFLSGTPFEATCSGGRGNNSFYGKGEVNAAAAVR